MSDSRKIIRIVTGTSIFDGHDASINIMRRIMQSIGMEVIHLGHNRSAEDIVTTAIQEDAHGIAITSYQGGHTEFFTYILELLKEKNGAHIKVFAGGGGTILPAEVTELHKRGMARIYTPDDGRKMGLKGMIEDIAKQCLEVESPTASFSDLSLDHPEACSRLITMVENGKFKPEELHAGLSKVSSAKKSRILGVTGTGGSGKSSLVDELIHRTLDGNKDISIAIISIDPSKRKTGGALLGDRIRMNSIYDKRVFMRSLATRGSGVSTAPCMKEAIEIVKAAGYDLIILETSGIGQSDSQIVDLSEHSLYVMTPEYGAATQLEKIDMIDFADFIAINKFDKPGAKDALRDVSKQYLRSRDIFDQPIESAPVYATMASHFNDHGVNLLHQKIMRVLFEQKGQAETSKQEQNEVPRAIIPVQRRHYLSAITQKIHQHKKWIEEQCALAEKVYQLKGVLEDVEGEVKKELLLLCEKTESQLDEACQQHLKNWDCRMPKYAEEKFTYRVRNKEIEVELNRKSLSGTKIPRVSTPKYSSWGDRLHWMMNENLPGEYPFTAGVFPFKREGEDPTRMFAGEGSPERTNRRFHYLSIGMPASRLSTAFDSVTLYGEDPDLRPDIYGKIGNSGVSVASLDDAKRLYSGFDLSDSKTSVSMTINGPAPIILGFFLNAAIDQNCEKYIHKEGLVDEVKSKIASIYKDKGVAIPLYREELPEGHNGLGLMLLGVSGDEVLGKEVYEKIKAETLKKVRGTVQADILKEDQAQNTCIFSTEFALGLMSDVQKFFIQNSIQNFYSVSISGYHIAEAGANPITQLALTLANGFTYVEFYLMRGMKVDDFAPNFSFFFSNGLDPEYSVIGRVARRIWARAMKLVYGAGERSQKLKYHIQTSGRSLHSQEIDFNDIRTTLQALYAIYDNCNSLHTNAYDEAITTPTEGSVRRALAIQLIINKELGLTKNENPLQGSFIIEELSDLVEEAVLKEFDSICERGGVLGAMETMYQRGKIQDESMLYEAKKEDGSLPVIGVNTFLASDGSPFVTPGEVIRATEEEKMNQIESLNLLKKSSEKEAELSLANLKKAILCDENSFAEMMQATKTCSLGQISKALYSVGGQYRRNM